MPITDDQVDVLRSWYDCLREAQHKAVNEPDHSRAYGYILGACTDVEVEIVGVLSGHGVQP
jgi:hypothetical protein